MHTTGTRFSVRFFTVVLICAGLLLGMLIIYDYNSEESVNNLKDRYNKIEHFRDNIIHFNEVLSMSARMAAATGDIKWEERYQEYEPKLTSAIEQAINLSPEIYRKTNNRDNIRTIKLLDMEHEAFTLIRHGQGKAAMDILFGKQYEIQENNYTGAIDRLNSLLKRQMEAALTVEHSNENLARIAFITVLCLLLLSWLIIIRITRRAQEDLVKLNQQLNLVNCKLKVLVDAQKDFSSMISHELRVPLSSIKAAIDIVISTMNTENTLEQKNFLGMAKSNVDRLTRMLNDILDLAQLESGKVILDKKPMDINKIIQSVAQTQESVAKSKGLYLKLSLNTNLPLTSIDEDKFIQVLNNLLANAIKFTVTGGITISSTTDEEKHQVEVRITDTGCGIKEEDIIKLFEKFQQLKNPQQRHSGTGLGLAICREIIRQHGGKIGVESKQAQGSSFYFILPV